MIPKIIHWCWLSDDPLPKEIQECVNSWDKVLPDYEIKKWDFSVFPKGKSRWVDQAFEARKFAFAADYIRNYALYTEGGIYLDSDVEVLKSFNPLLHLPYFLGYENGSGCIEAAVMGAEGGNPIFKMLLDYYDTHDFVKMDGSYDILPLPRRLREQWSPHYDSVPIENPEEFVRDEKKLCILPYDYFSPIHLETRGLMKTDRTYSIHHFAASWSKGWPYYRRKIKFLLGPQLTRYGIIVKRFFFGVRKD